MILDITSARASWSNNRLSVAFEVVPEGRDHLDLKSGEIFQRGNYAAFRKQEDKAIRATLFVTCHEQNQAGLELPSEMRYRPGISGSDAEIWLVWRLSDDNLTGFHSLLVAGKTPRTAVVFLADALEFGWEPDGSGQKWDNEKIPSVPIANVRFDFEFDAPSAHDEFAITDSPEEGNRAFYSDIASVNFSLLNKLSVIENNVARLARLVSVLLVILGILLWRIWLGR